MSSTAIWQLFCRTYGTAPGPLVYKTHHLETAGDNHQVQQLVIQVGYQHQLLRLQGAGNGPIDALVAALRHSGFDIEIVDYEERALNAGSGAEAIALVAITGQTQSQRYYGMGTHSNITTASILAILNGLNRWLQAQGNQETGEQKQQPSLCV